MLKALETKIDYVFKNPQLLTQALTHRSYRNENKAKRYPDNERLEFLGDALLGFVVRDYLFTKFPEKSPGELTVLTGSLVTRETAAEIASSLGLNEFLLLSRGESKDFKSRKTILANTFEALIAAIYLDQGFMEGFRAAERFIKKFVLIRLDKNPTIDSLIDWKSKLQTVAQEKIGMTPRYEMMSSRGPDHNKVFVMAAYLGDSFVAKGKGKNKKEAELMAAKNALQQMK